VEEEGHRAYDVEVTPHNAGTYCDTESKHDTRIVRDEHDGSRGKRVHDVGVAFWGEVVTVTDLFGDRTKRND